MGSRTPCPGRGGGWRREDGFSPSAVPKGGSPPGPTAQSPLQSPPLATSPAHPGGSPISAGSGSPAQVTVPPGSPSPVPAPGKDASRGEAVQVTSLGQGEKGRSAQSPGPPDDYPPPHRRRPPAPAPTPGRAQRPRANSTLPPDRPLTPPAPGAPPPPARPWGCPLRSPDPRAPREPQWVPGSGRACDPSCEPARGLDHMRARSRLHIQAPRSSLSLHLAPLQQHPGSDSPLLSRARRAHPRPDAAPPHRSPHPSESFHAV
uniref:Basic salivary proline-rich protein 1-like n=1 Tax=Phascolarctos cinereus TaxID=38626 RepID=A0A6P5JY87_PHACI|nr:basic salivary proline-rich protein 1-like [Phascolarctos cinereus]